MARTPIWKSISDTLTAEISQAHYKPGEKLPTEAQLAARFGVNRHTVRHALSAMADNGLVHSRRGAGVFVTQTPTTYPIGRRVRFHQNLTDAGRVPTKRILALMTRGAGPRERDALKLASNAEVHYLEGLSLADGQPIALSRSVFPAARFPTLPKDIEDTQSITEVFARAGIFDYTRVSTEITAKLATATQALHLQIPEASPILRSIGVNADPEGQPIEYGHTWFAGDRVTLSVTDL